MAMMLLLIREQFIDGIKRICLRGGSAVTEYRAVGT